MTLNHKILTAFLAGVFVIGSGLAENAYAQKRKNSPTSRPGKFARKRWTKWEFLEHQFRQTNAIRGAPAA
jgi:hypothetical protein